jgi:hypothetical protein
VGPKKETNGKRDDRISFCHSKISKEDGESQKELYEFSNPRPVAEYDV